MKFNYKLKRLCGSYYGHVTTTATTGDAVWKGSNLVFDNHSGGNVLYTAVSNRIQVLDLQRQIARTLSTEGRSSIRHLALSPDDRILLAVDVNDYCQVIHVSRGICLHRFRFSGGGPVHRIQYSPTGQYVAVTAGKRIQVWYAPFFAAAAGQGGDEEVGHDDAAAASTVEREFMPVVLHRTYAASNDTVTCLDWSSDSTVLAAGARDGKVQLYTVNTVRGYKTPITLSGHSSAVLFVKLLANTTAEEDRLTGAYTVSRDGTLVTWQCTYTDGRVTLEEEDESNDRGSPDDDEEGHEEMGEAAVSFFTGGGTHVPSSNSKKRKRNLIHEELFFEDQAHALVHGQWKYTARHYFLQEQAVVTSVCYNTHQQLLAVTFSNGIFGLYEMPACSNMYTLSTSSHVAITTSVLNPAGDWLATASADTQQVLVWEWKSESYILKQRGHVYGMQCMAYSPDGVIIVTGGEDACLKVWNASSGYCYVTIGGTSDTVNSLATAGNHHTAPITAVAFATASVVLSASLDGTVRAHDLYRYRTFRTFTTPTPVQFTAVAADPAGEIVTAGSTDPFHIYLWNLQTAQLLDVLAGHTGPISSLAFLPVGSTVVSASWDGTVKLWDVYKANVATETLQHTADVVCVTVSPNSQQICSSSVNGMLQFWNVETTKLQFEIDGKKDIKGGRKFNDRQTVDNNAASRYFTSVCYSADGTTVLAGGNSKYVCIYHVETQMLLKKFQVTHNRSLDGVLDELNSRNLGAWGPLDDHAESDDEDEKVGARRASSAKALPGAKHGDDGSRTSRVEVLTRQVAFSSTGREWAAISGEGLHVYSLDDDMIFDPISLTESITPAAIEGKLRDKAFGLALRMALHLNELALVKDVLEQTPYTSIAHVVRSIGPEQLERLLQVLATVLSDGNTPHLEFYLQWCLQILSTHGLHLDRNRGKFMRAFRAVHKAVQTRYEELRNVADENKYTLDFIQDQAQLLLLP